MQYDNVIELQAKVFKDVFAFEELPTIASGTRRSQSVFVKPQQVELLAAKSSGSRRARNDRSESDDIALGVVEREKDTRLAVLVQSRRLLKSPILDKIIDLAHGEADPIYVGRVKPRWTRARNDPLRLGCSVSPDGVTYSGTLGCFAADSQTGAIGILSNNHVLADVNQTKVGTSIVQQGGGDLGSSADSIAKLSKFVHIAFGGVPNAVDAAFAEILDHGRGEDRRTLFDGGSPPVAQATVNAGPGTAATILMPVQKTGRTTVHTRGRVVAVNVNNLNIDMGIGIARFDNQIAIEMNMKPARPFSLPGDSGSLIVDSSGRAVGLLFAGSDSGGAGNKGTTFANPIDTVLAQLGIRLV